MNKNTKKHRFSLHRGNFWWNAILQSIKKAINIPDESLWNLKSHILKNGTSHREPKEHSPAPLSHQSTNNKTTKREEVSLTWEEQISTSCRSSTRRDPLMLRARAMISPRAGNVKIKWSCVWELLGWRSPGQNNPSEAPHLSTPSVVLEPRGAHVYAWCAGLHRKWLEGWQRGHCREGPRWGTPTMSSISGSFKKCWNNFVNLHGNFVCPYMWTFFLLTLSCWPDFLNSRFTLKQLFPSLPVFWLGGRDTPQSWLERRHNVSALTADQTR